jgi:23S rRNA (adenine2503-C2)-methyltransferase
MKLDWHSISDSDGSVKYRFRTSDDHFVEALSFTYHGDGLIILCLSTQIGCDMGCKFCGTGLQKRIRNLTQEEIVQQATIIVDQHLGGKQPSTIVLAGSGEPLANYQASMNALETFRNLYGNIRLQLSTVGLTQKICRMVEEKRTFGLYISLHGPDDETRKRLMPAAERHPIVPLITAAEEYAKINPGLVRICYLLLQGINDTEEQLYKLIDLVKDKNFVVQLRLWNPITGIDLQRISMRVAEDWESKLKQAGIKACIRPSVGQEIAGGCGQMTAAASKRPINQEDAE